MRSLARDASEVVRDHLELATLEAQRAAIGLAKMLSAVVFVAVLLATAWLALVAAAIVWITTAGAGWGAALALAATLNLALAVAVAYWARSHAGELLFAATLRQLRRTADEVDLEAP